MTQKRRAYFRLSAKPQIPQMNTLFFAQHRQAQLRNMAPKAMDSAKQSMLQRTLPVFGHESNFNQQAHHRPISAQHGPDRLDMTHEWRVLLSLEIKPEKNRPFLA